MQIRNLAGEQGDGGNGKFSSPQTHTLIQDSYSVLLHVEVIPKWVFYLLVLVYLFMQVF